MFISSDDTQTSRIISVEDIYRVSRKAYTKNPVKSCWAILNLIELSRQLDFAVFSSLSAAFDSKSSTRFHAHIYRSFLESLGVIVSEKEIVYDTRFDLIKAKISGLDCVPFDSYEGRESYRLYESIKIYQNQHRSTSLKLALILYGVKIRKIETLSNLAKFVGDINGTSCARILGRCSQLGLVAIVKTGSGSGGAVHIFDIGG